MFSSRWSDLDGECGSCCIPGDSWILRAWPWGCFGEPVGAESGALISPEFVLVTPLDALLKRDAIVSFTDTIDGPIERRASFFFFFFLRFRFCSAILVLFRWQWHTTMQWRGTHCLSSVVGKKCSCLELTLAPAVAMVVLFLLFLNVCLNLDKSTKVVFQVRESCCCCRQGNGFDRKYTHRAIRLRLRWSTRPHSAIILCCIVHFGLRKPGGLTSRQKPQI